MRSLRLAVSISTLLAVHFDAADAEEPRFRRPVAIDISANGEWLYTANQDSGTVSIVDASNRMVVDEIAVGERLSDLVAVREQGLLLCLDEARHKLIVLRQIDDRWSVVTQARVAEFPNRLLWDAATNRCFVSSLWSRTLTAFRLSVRADGIDLHPAGTIGLPFEPREMCLDNEEQHIIVADAFQADLAIVDSGPFQLKAIKKVPGHNIRGMAVSSDGKRLLLAQQELNPMARSSRDDVHWGNMIANLLVSYPLSAICDPHGDALRHRTVHQLGEPTNGAGDPGRIVLGANGEITVLLSGVHEIAIGGKEAGQASRRVAVGKRPVSAAMTRVGRIYVTNLFADSISVVDIGQAKELDRISLGSSPTLGLADHGEMLFFDGRISHDGWMSCHSCHTDGHTNGELNDNLSDGSFAAPKRVLSLLGVADTTPWAWNGTVQTLERQVVNSVEKTMQGTPPDDAQVEALVAYLKTLSSPPVLGRDPTKRLERVARGRQLFRSLDCGRCHTPPTYTSPNTYDVGLKDELGNHQFNPPSLRGVATRRSFFHDGRATSLAAVFTNHKHQITGDLSPSDLKSLLDYLMSI